MKKLYYTLAAALCCCLLTNCGKGEEGEKVFTVQFYAYWMYIPGSSEPFDPVSARVYFFDAGQGQRYKEERIFVPGGTKDYDKPEYASEMVSELYNNNRLALEDGTLVEALPLNPTGKYYFYMKPDVERPWEFATYSETKADIPVGKYYVVMLSTGYGVSGQKYSGKYIKVKKNMPTDDRILKKIFPEDVQHKGFIDWINPDSWVYRDDLIP